jgi:hypothetical protein
MVDARVSESDICKYCVVRTDAMPIALILELSHLLLLKFGLL